MVSYNSSDEKKKIIARLEKKAESILKRIGEIKRPVFIEFCGTPKAGKTTVVSSLDLFLRRNGYKVEVIRERASVYPIPKKNHMHFNIWTSIMTLSNMLVLLDSNNDVVLIDRGFFDSMSWFYWMRNSGRLTEGEFNNIDHFMCMDRWASLIDIVFILIVNYETAREREFIDLLTLKTDSIMNERVIKQYNHALNEAQEHIKKKFRFIDLIDTTKLPPMEGVREITERALEVLDISLDERILAIPKKAIEDIYGSNSFVPNEGKIEIDSLIKAEGEYIPRSKVERSDDYVQLIPCGIIEHEGNILLLKRKENDTQNRLHEKYVIWAGGHVRKQDISDDTLATGIKRELAEELFIKSQYTISKPIGFVHFDNNPKTRRHLGVIYKISLSDNEVALGLDQTESKERRGKSVSGTFQSLNDLKSYIVGMEEWSKSILRVHYNLLSDDFSAPDLFNN